MTSICIKHGKYRGLCNDCPPMDDLLFHYHNPMESTTFGFEKALLLLKEGKSLTRRGWNGKGLFITLQVPDEHSKMTRAYMYITTPPGSTNQFGEVNEAEQRVPWLASQTDLLVEDWQVVE